jgi:predicted dienelactone hydrolase
VRPFEVLLLAACAVAVAGLVLRRRRQAGLPRSPRPRVPGPPLVPRTHGHGPARVPRTRVPGPALVPRTLVHVPALVPLLAAAVQALAEGPRWQLVPAYALAVLCAAAWPARRPRGRVLTAVAGTGLLVVAAVPPLALPVVTFPPPTGPYGVGTLTYHWKDPDRPETFTPDPRDHREVMAQIWYPARTDATSPRAPYLEDAAAVTPAVARVLGVPEFVLGHLDQVMTNAVPAAPVHPGEPRYPVLVLLHGLQGFRQAYTFQAEELASRGYVVAAVDMTYAAAAVVFPGGRRALYDHRLDDDAFEDAQVPHLAGDVALALDRLADLGRADPRGVLTGRLDLDRAGVIGQSLGAIVGSQACSADARIKACLLEDGYMSEDAVRNGLRQPAMWITRDAENMRLERSRAGGWPEHEIVRYQRTMRQVFASLPAEGYLVLVDGMFHLDMTDGPLMVAPPLAGPLGLSGPIGGARAHEVINTYGTAFFDRVLKGRDVPLRSSGEVRVYSNGSAGPVP